MSDDKQSGSLNANVGGDMNVGGDLAGRDKITNNYYTPPPKPPPLNCPCAARFLAARSSWRRLPPRWSRKRAVGRAD
jgi:hypothetical protein